MSITSIFEAGRLTIYMPQTFSKDEVEAFKNAHKEHLDNVTSSVVIDFRETDFLDSIGIGMLLNMRGNLNRDFEISFINSNDTLRKIFSICNFYKIFDIKS